MKRLSLKLYIITFILTLCIFGAALYISKLVNRQKTDELKTTEDKVTVDILNLETELDALKSSSCTALTASTLRNELTDLNARLTFMESQVGTNDPDVFRLKRYYALLEVRDYLLTTQAAKECKRNDILILYFYSLNNCSSCTTQNYILQAAEDEHPEVKAYSFDYNLDLGAVKNQISLPNVPDHAPFMVIGGKYFAPFDTLSDLDSIINPLLASSTVSTSSTKNVSTTTKK